ncbi:MAG: glycosyltransferase [Bacilli bacterium]|nr:glycosyltransferase [Bacilli bacterium]
MEALARALDNSGIDYIWYVFTEDTDAINSPNVVYMKPRLDVSRWIKRADYVIQLSDTEACSYTINEALYRNIPVIVTPLPYLEEIGYKDGKTGYTLKFDCSNLNEIVEKIQKIPSFNFVPLKDRYGELFTNRETRFKEDNMNVKIRVIEPYWDLQLHPDEKDPNKVLEKGFEWVVAKERADYLVQKGLVEIVEIVEEPKEDKKVPTKKVEKRK